MAARRRISPEEQALWERVAASVTPLRRKPLLPDAVAEPEPAGPRPSVREAEPKPGAGSPAGPPAAPVALPAKAAKNSVPALDKRTAQRLRKGKMPIEGRLDLHGMTQREAHGALHRFIGASRAMNRRLVLVITGKGWDPTASRREDAVGVLRRSVPRWLETPPLNQHVAAVTNAHAKDGGSGALYVLLRRQRRMMPLTRD